jgi:hypothetical protein
MLGLAEILAWLDTWQIPRRWPAGPPAPFRQASRTRSRAVWARGGHFGASQVPECENIGPGGIDIDQLTRVDTTLVGGLPRVDASPIHLEPRLPAAPSLSVAGV